MRVCALQIVDFRFLRARFYILMYVCMCGGVCVCMCTHMFVRRKRYANALQKVDGDGSDSFANSNFIYLFSFPATK